MFIYEPNKESVYKLPILDTDPIMPVLDWRHVMDTYVANNGHAVTKQKLKKHIRYELEMLVEDLWETFDLCADKMIEEISKS